MLHAASLTCDPLQRYAWQVTNHTFRDRDLAPRDFHPFGPCKKHLAGKRFTKDADMKQVVTSWLQTLDTHFFYIACKPCCHVGPMLKWQWCLPEFVMCTACCPFAVCSKGRLNSFLRAFTLYCSTQICITTAGLFTVLQLNPLRYRLANKELGIAQSVK